MPHILQRIASHKKDLRAVCPAGLARGHRGNPAASLRVHQLHAAPVLLSGVATLVLNKAEKNILETHYKCTVQQLQRLHPRTPRAVVYFLAGCLPGEAVLHCRQLGLFSMICNLPGDPLHSHARFILSSAPPKAKSWFQQVRDLCSQYDLPSPLQLLDNPQPKETFKKLIKTKVTEYWQALLRVEVSPLRSLQYFKPELYSLTKAHYMWTSAASNPFECSKSTILARMVSGRYRTEVLCRHWSNNKEGNCRAASCHQTPGTLEHLLVVCPALETVRERQFSMWLERSVMYPTLHSTVRDVLASNEAAKVQFILEPLAFPQLANCYQMHGQRFIEQLSYLTRTFAFYIHREYQKILKLAKTKSPPNESLSDLPNPIPVTANTGSQPLHHTGTDVTLQLTSAGHDQYQPGHSHGGAPHSTNNTCCYSTTSTQHYNSASPVQLTRVTTPVSPTPCLLLSAGFQQHTAGQSHVLHIADQTAHHGAWVGNVGTGNGWSDLIATTEVSFHESILLSSDALSVSPTSEEGELMLD